MHIISLTHEQEQLIRQAAQLLTEEFKIHWPEAWPTLQSGLDEVYEMLAPDRLLRLALDESGKVAGWIGAIPQYDGLVWELHPLVVRSDLQRQGVGTALVSDLEGQLRTRGAITLTLGTDDEDGSTSLSHTDLYRDTWRKISQIRNLKNHPYSFYQKLGFTITGVVPDANGVGKPDILMSKRISPGRI